MFRCLTPAFHESLKAMCNAHLLTGGQTRARPLEEKPLRPVLAQPQPEACMAMAVSQNGFMGDEMAATPRSDIGPPPTDHIRSGRGAETARQRNTGLATHACPAHPPP